MESKYQYINDFKRANYKRVALELKKADFEVVQAAAAAVGDPVNTWIKKAIAEKLEREKGT